MPRLPRVSSFFRNLFHKQRIEHELDEEVRAYVNQVTSEKIQSGLSPREARRTALIELGGVEQVKEQVRQVRIGAFVDTLLKDVSLGFRMLRQAPGFTAVAVLSLALGIGANTAIFSLIDAVLLKTLPIQNPQELVAMNWHSMGEPDVWNGLSGNINGDASGRTTSPSFSYPMYEQLRTRNHVFSNVLALAANGSQFNLGYRGEPGRAEGELISGTFFATLGVQPALGRMLTPDDDRLGSSPAAVISYRYWEGHFGRDPGIVGRSVTLNGVPFTVVGICPPEFFGVQPGRAVDVWVPLHQQPQVEPRWAPQPEPADGKTIAPDLFEQRRSWWVVMLGRRKPGVTEQQAQAEADVILQQSMAHDIKAGTKPETIPHLEVTAGSQGLDNLRREFSKPLGILMAVVGLMLLISCANVANLLLARGTSRQKEMAVRLAIGASRPQLVRQLLTESILLAALGGALGLVLAFWSTDLLVAFMSSGNDPLHLTVRPDPWVLGFTATVSVLTGILFGLAPALRSTRLDLTPALKASEARELGAASGTSRQGRRLELGKTLVVAQVSLSLLLLVGAGLFLRTLSNLENVNTGFKERNLLLFGIDPTQGGYEGQRIASFYQELMRHVAAQPGVRSVTMSGQTLIGGGMNTRGTFIQNPPKNAGKAGGVIAYVNEVGPNFFETMEIPLVLGRTIHEADVVGAPKVAVVNEEFAHRFLDGSSPIGRRFGFDKLVFDKKGSGEFEIVGVVGNARYDDLRHDIPTTIYLAALQDTTLGAVHFEVRTAGDPNLLVPAIRRVAQGLDNNLALYDVRSQTEQIEETLFQERLFARLTGFFGALALLLGCTGVYGVMAFAVTRRTREIGIRIALGAKRGEIVSMVLGETLTLVAIGVALGVLAALAAERLVASFLFGLKPNDPLTIAGAALLMVVSAAFAGYVPARRASRVDPMVSLRYE